MATVSHPNWLLLTEDPPRPAEEGRAAPFWQTLESTEVLPAPRPVRVDRVLVRPGVETEYQYRPRGRRAVFVLPVTPEGEAVLIRQYRYPLRATITEIVAGGVEDGEDLLQAAARELREEVGGAAGRWVPLAAFYPQPSVSGVAFYPLLALDVVLGEAAQEDTETIERLPVPLLEAYAMLERGEILDGSSCLVLWQARAELQRLGLL